MVQTFSTGCGLAESLAGGYSGFKNDLNNAGFSGGGDPPIKRNVFLSGVPKTQAAFLGLC
jgi:hypothetical protein